MEEYIRLISNSVTTSNGQSFSQALQLPSQLHTSIQSHLRQHPIDSVLRRISFKTPNEQVNVRLGQVITAHLQYVQTCPPIHDVLSNAKANLSTLQAAHPHWSTLFGRSSKLFTLPDSPLFFLDGFRYVSSTFLTLSIRLDIASNQSVKYPNLTECTAKLAGPVRAAGTDRTAKEGKLTKRAAVMWLGNDCLRGYFKLNNLKLCETVLKSIREALARNREYRSSTLAATSSADAQDDDPSYPLSERVRYRYYLGRIRISQGRVREAFTHLQWAFEHCHYDSATHARRILLHLLPCVLVLGIRPAKQLCTLINTRFPDLQFLFLPLFQAYAKPDLVAFDDLLNDRRRKETLRKLGVYLMIKEKCPIGMWRGIVKRCLLLSLPATPQNPNAPPTLHLSKLSKAVHFCSGSSSDVSSSPTQLTQMDVECILSSLIDQGYIKGYTFHSKQLLVLQKGHLMGFPPVREVY